MVPVLVRNPMQIAQKTVYRVRTSGTMEYLIPTVSIDGWGAGMGQFRECVLINPHAYNDVTKVLPNSNVASGL